MAGLSRFQAPRMPTTAAVSKNYLRIDTGFTSFRAAPPNAIPHRVKEVEPRHMTACLMAGWTPTPRKNSKNCVNRNARLKRLLAEAELVKDALREVAKDAPIDVKC